MPTIWRPNVSARAVRFDWCQCFLYQSAGVLSWLDTEYPVAIPLIKNHGSVSSLTGSLVCGIPIRDLPVGGPFRSRTITIVKKVNAAINAICTPVGNIQQIARATGSDRVRNTWLIIGITCKETPHRLWQFG